MRHHDVLSSVLESVGYDPMTKTMEVDFRESGRYLYFGVPARVYDSLLCASSKGRYFDSRIRDVYAYRKI